MRFVHLVFVSLLLAAFAVAQNNPVPLLNNPVVPATVAPGSGTFTLTLNGTGFVTGTVVKWNGSAAATTFVSSSQLTAVIAAGNVAKAGTAIVTVANPSPGGGTSNLELFTIGTPTSGSALTFAQINELGIANAELPHASGMAVIGDWNNDGKLDVAWSETDNFSFGYLLNVLSNGDGTPQAPVIEEPGPGYNFGTVLAGDFNNDGKLDLVVDSTASAKFPMNYTNLALGGGDGTFTASTSIANYLAQAVGDFNADGNLDFIADNPGLWTFLGNGDGTFQNPLASDGNDPDKFLVAGDFNRDGKLDIIADSPGLFAAGNGDGTFQPSVTIPTLGNSQPLIAAAMNGDGFLDLISATTVGGIAVRLGNGDGTFQTPVNYDSGDIAKSQIVVRDLNADGKLDVAFLTSNKTGISIVLLLGNGDGTLQNPVYVALPQLAKVGAYSELAAGDFNNDGKMDLFVPAYFSLTEDGVANYYSSILLLQGAVVLALVSPTTLSFGPQAPGMSSSAKVGTLTNSGTASLTISSIAFNGSDAGDFAQTNNCGSTLAANSSCQINVTYTPLAVGSRSATLTITDNASGGPQTQTVSLSGTVEDFTISASPTSVTVTPGQAGNYVVTASPVNGFNQKIAFTCSGNPSGSTCTVSPSSVTLNGVATVNVAVVTTTTSAGLAAPDGRNGSGALAAWVTLPGMMGLVVLTGKRPKASRSLSTCGILFICLISLGMGMAGCGGGGSSGGGTGTAPGTYTVTVTGTYAAGSAALAHSAPVTLVVQ